MELNKEYLKLLATDVAKIFIDIPYLVCLFITAIIKALYKSFNAKPKSLQNEIILVTGAASGLGREVVLKLASISVENCIQSKVTLVLWDVNEKGLKETKEKCEELGLSNVHTYVVDLMKREYVTKCAEQVRQNVGQVTILYNNHGIAVFKTFIETDPELEEKVIKINLLSYMWTIKEFLPGMLKKRKGHIVSTCSGLSFCRFDHLSSYCASKYGLRGFLACLKLEMKRMNPDNPNLIKFSTIYPGFIKTPMIGPMSWEPRYKILGLEKLYDSDWVAGEIVDGILKEKEDIFVPKSMWWVQWFFSLLPTEYVDKYEQISMKNLRFSDSQQHCNFNTQKKLVRDHEE